MIAEAAKGEAQFILLPEAMDLGWTDPSALTKAEPGPDRVLPNTITGRTGKILSHTAK